MDASAYSGFHKALAQIIVPHLKPYDTLCDIGCGLGRLDLELAPYVSEILAVDISEYAIGVLSRDVERAGVKNVRARQGATEDLEGVFDIILMSLYGSPDMPMLLEHCRRKIIRIVSAGKKSGLYPERHRREVKFNVPNVQDDLTALKIGYTLEFCSLEFGQPLRTWQDAESFILNNAPDASKDEINDFLNEKIERTGRPDFPFYLPYQKELGIFIIDK